MGTQHPDSVTKSVGNLDLSTIRRQAGVEADGRAIKAYEVAAEMGVHPTQVSLLETGRRQSLPGGMGRQSYIDAVERIAKRRKAAAATEGDAA